MIEYNLPSEKEYIFTKLKKKDELNINIRHSSIVLKNQLFILRIETFQGKEILVYWDNNVSLVFLLDDFLNNFKNKKIDIYNNYFININSIPTYLLKLINFLLVKYNQNFYTNFKGVEK